MKPKTKFEISVCPCSMLSFFFIHFAGLYLNRYIFHFARDLKYILYARSDTTKTHITFFSFICFSFIN